MSVKMRKPTWATRSIPEEIIPFSEELRQQEGVIGNPDYGRFFEGGSNRPFDVEIKGYDSLRGVLEIRINNPKFRQRVRIPIDPSKRTAIEDFITNYEF